MFSEADAFLDAIFEHPDDDTARLVYADWLEEHGQANYAQFIRLQCAAAREKFWSPEANRLWEEIGRTWSRVADEWWPATVDPWPGLPTPYAAANYSLDAVYFDRGFLRSTISLTALQLRRYDRCWPWLPTPVSTLTVSDDDGNLRDVASVPSLRRIRHLRCVVAGGDRDGYRVVEPDELNALLCSPFLTNIRELDLSAVWLTRSSIDVLLTAPNLGTVQELYVDFDRRSCDPNEALLQLKAQFPHVVQR